VSDIYLVDDHALLRDGLRAVLHSGGHRVVGESDDPTRALADLQRLQPQILLLDLHLGQRSGFELLEQVRRRALPVRTIVLTMVAEPGPLTRALQLGASAYVLKGSPAAELLAAVQAVAAQRRYLSPQAAELLAAGVASAPAASALGQLSAREQQVVAMVVRGCSSAEIGERLHLSPKTVDTYRSRLMTKLGVADVPALVRLAIREGLISADEP
jgi:DNA-binding NarL/FixJ family response regulator